MVQDPHDCLRLVLPQWTVPDLVQLALEEPVHFAEGQPAVLRRLARLLQELAWRAPRGTLDGPGPVYLEQAVRSAEESTQIDTAEIALWRRDVAAAFAGAWGSRG